MDLGEVKIASSLSRCAPDVPGPAAPAVAHFRVWSRGLGPRTWTRFAAQSAAGDGRPAAPQPGWFGWLEWDARAPLGFACSR